MSNISFSELNASNKVLPDIVTSDTGGMTTIYESKGGSKSKSKSRSKRTGGRRDKKKRRHSQTVDRSISTTMHGGKSKKSKSRRCKNKVINIYM